MINLLPPNVKRDIKFARYNVTLLQYAVMLVVTIGIVIFLMMFGLQTLENTKSDLEASLVSDRARAAALQDVNAQASELSATIDTIGGILDQEVKFSFLLREIGSVMPPGAKLSALSLSQDNTQPVRLTVDLTTAEKAGVLQQNLAESRLFIGADILTVSQSAPGSAYGFAADLQAYYDPTFPLNTLDDPVEEEAETLPPADIQPESTEPEEPVETEADTTAPEPETTPEDTEEETSNQTGGGAS